MFYRILGGARVDSWWESVKAAPGYGGRGAGTQAKHPLVATDAPGQAPQPEPARWVRA